MEPSMMHAQDGSEWARRPQPQPVGLFFFKWLVKVHKYAIPRYLLYLLL